MKNYKSYSTEFGSSAKENVELTTETAKSPMDPLAMVKLTERANTFRLSFPVANSNVLLLRVRLPTSQRFVVRRTDGRPRPEDRRYRFEAIARINMELGTTTAVFTHNAAIAKKAQP